MKVRNTYTTPQCVEYELLLEGSTCIVAASKNASINPFDSGDTDLGMFGN